MSHRPGLHRKGGRPKKYPGVLTITLLKLPGQLFSAVTHDVAETGVDRVDLITFYLVEGWNKTHGSAMQLSKPQYLIDMWASASSALSTLVDMPPISLDIDPNARYEVRPRLPQEFHREVGNEAWDAGVPLIDLGAAYILLGRNLHHSAQLEMPKYLEETLRQAQAHTQEEALLAAV